MNKQKGMNNLRLSEREREREKERERERDMSSVSKIDRWSGLVSFISNFVGYLMPKPSL